MTKHRCDTNVCSNAVFTHSTIAHALEAVRRVRSVAVEDVQGGLGEVDVHVEDEHEVGADEARGVTHGGAAGALAPHNVLPQVQHRVDGQQQARNAQGGALHKEPAGDSTGLAKGSTVRASLNRNKGDPRRHTTPRQQFE